MREEMLNVGQLVTICGTGTSREGAGRCPTTCRRIRPWERGASGSWPCSASRASPPALAIFWPRGALWCVLSARAIATLIRAYRRYARRRRSPAAGTACAAACIVAINVHHQPLEFHTRRLQHGNDWVETSVWCLWCGVEGTSCEMVRFVFRPFRQA